MPTQIGIFVFPRLTQLDFTGPLEVLHRLPDVEVHLVSERSAPVSGSGGLAIHPTTIISASPPLDVLLVPGGSGTAALLTNEIVLAWLAAQAKKARYVTSVCTGALVLGAAGLLDGFRATTHWAYMDLLPTFGAIPVDQRVVIDGNRITAGGVTAGIDFGLRIATQLAGREAAEAIQLTLEYDPEPPFACGHPDRAEPTLVQRVSARMTPSLTAHRAQADAWAARRGNGNGADG